MIGWITNEGKVIECEVYNHFSCDNKVLQDIWTPLQEEIDSAAEYCRGLSEAGEHPEWHHVEMCESDCQSRAYQEAYVAGFLRVTTWNIKGEVPSIAVEGLPQWIETHKYVLKELADKYECRIKTLPVEIKKRRW